MPLDVLTTEAATHARVAADGPIPEPVKLRRSAVRAVVCATGGNARIQRLGLVSVTLAVLLSGCGAQHVVPAFREDRQQDGYPGATWTGLLSLEEAGWSAERLRAAQAYADSIGSAAVMIVQSGVVVDEWGGTEQRFRSHSMRKSLLSALYGIYVAEGKIDLQKSMGELGIDDTPPSLTEVEKQARVVELLRARSGIYHPALAESPDMAAARPARGSHAPGSFWYYNNWDFNALGTIFRQLTGLEIGQAFRQRIAEPLQMEDFRPEDVRLEEGEISIHPGYPFNISARDLARFGLLYLRGGKWRGQQIVPADWVRQSTRSTEQVSDAGGYEHMWWVEVNRKHLPGVDLGGGAFSARGFRGHYVLVIPSHDLVIVHRVNTFMPDIRVTDEQFGHLVRLILAAHSK